MIRRIRAGSSAGGVPAIAATSPPTVKLGPSARISTARTAWSAAQRRTASSKSSVNAGSMALRACGRFSVMTPTPFRDGEQDAALPHVTNLTGPARPLDV